MTETALQVVACERLVFDRYGNMHPVQEFLYHTQITGQWFLVRHPVADWNTPWVKDLNPFLLTDKYRVKPETARRWVKRYLGDSELGQEILTQYFSHGVRPWLTRFPGS